MGVQPLFSIGDSYGKISINRKKRICPAIDKERQLCKARRG
jgi:hypothetical protein